MRLGIILFLLIFSSSNSSCQNVHLEIGVNPYVIFSDEVPSSFYNAQISGIQNKSYKLTAFLPRFNLNLGSSAVSYVCECNYTDGSVLKGTTVRRTYRMIYLSIGKGHKLWNDRFRLYTNIGGTFRKFGSYSDADRIFVEYYEVTGEVTFANVEYDDFGFTGEIQLSYNFFDNMDISLTSQFHSFFNNHKGVGLFMLGIGAKF